MALQSFLNPWTAPGDDRLILFSPFIREGDAICLAGEKGCGKSTAACEFIFKTFAPPCHADPTTGLLDPENPIEGDRELFGGLLRLENYGFMAGRKAVILDAENDHIEWRSLLNSTAEAYGVMPDSKTMPYFTENVLWKDATEGVTWNRYESAKSYIDGTLMPSLREVECGMLVVDSTHKLWTSNLNDSEWVSEGLGHLRKRCRQAGITLICLTHTSRNFEGKLPQNKFLPRGSSQQENEFDTIIGLERKLKGEKILKLHLIKRRAGKWNDEYTVGKVALSPTYGGYARLIENPWAKRDPRNPDVDLLSLAEKHFLQHFEPDKKLLFSKIPGNRQKTKPLCERLTDDGFLVEHKTQKGTYYSLSHGGIKLWQDLEKPIDNSKP